MEFIVNIKKDLKLKDPIMLIGLPGIGLVGKIVVEYIAQKTKSEKIGSIYGSMFPPLVLVDKKGKINLIKDELFYLKTKTQDFILVTGDVQPPIGNPQADEAHYYFAKKIIDIAKQLKVKKIYTFAGIDIGDIRITKDPKIQFATNSEKEKKILLKSKIKQTKEDLTISGAAGIVIGLAREEKIDGACILGETSGKLIYGDFDSAKSVLEFIVKHFKLNFNLKDIKTEADKITKAFKQIVDELKTISENQPDEGHRLTYTR